MELALLLRPCYKQKLFCYISADTRRPITVLASPQTVSTRNHHIGREMTVWQYQPVFSTLGVNYIYSPVFACTVHWHRLLAICVHTVGYPDTACVHLYVYPKWLLCLLAWLLMSMIGVLVSTSYADDTRTGALWAREMWGSQALYIASKIIWWSQFADSGYICNSFLL